ncbi:unnamed protein product [Nippostrongylus brasiliensis]|uniref:Uncharacterized protein n=1 Tax=Nippostrongylus brasiliensis TaxID=27835 RepID=A0A0N4YIR4_NIPBR|nr:unnamed protein product [Nippostrongylus brasiliensis]
MGAGGGNEVNAVTSSVQHRSTRTSALKRKQTMDRISFPGAKLDYQVNGNLLLLRALSPRIITRSGQSVGE